MSGIPFRIARRFPLALAFVLSALFPGHSQQPMNVILIVADDLGAADLNVYGSKDLRTPHLDQLAAEGARFTRFYVGASVCVPSRAAFLTGRSGVRTGVLSNMNALPGPEHTMAEMFKDAGYKTALFGKWHLGKSAEQIPNSQGFTEFMGHLDGCIENYHHDFLNWDAGTVLFHDLWHNQQPYSEDSTHWGEILTRETLKYLDQNRAAPFFLYAAFNNPHYPVQPLPFFFNQFKDMAEPRRSYAAFIAQLDDEVGRIVKHVDDLGLRKNTLIVFMSDNGHSQESRNKLFVPDYPADAAYGGGTSAPYRGHKGEVLEGGIRLPFIVSLPGTVPAGVTRGQMVSSLDLMPTFARMTGLQTLEGNQDGSDISRVLTADAPSPHSGLYWKNFDGTWAATQGKWKLHHDGTGNHLYDVTADPGEAKDVAAGNPALVDSLATAYARFVADGEAGLPALGAHDLCVGGSVQASGSLLANLPEYAFDDSLLKPRKWVAPTAACWIRYDFQGTAKHAVNRYSLVSGNDAAGRDPKAWKLQGSHDGNAWQTLDTRADVAFAGRVQKREFVFANTMAYETYRLDITANGGDSLTQLMEVEMFADDVSGLQPPLHGTAALRDGDFGLKGCFPNPFVGATQIVFDVPADVAGRWGGGGARSGGGIWRVSLSIYAADGMRVANLIPGPLASGLNRMAWDGRDEAGKQLPPGVYLARLSTVGRISFLPVYKAR